MTPLFSAFAFAFAFTLQLTTQLSAHLGISTLAAASDLTFRIALYVLLKLEVVPGPCTVVDAQELDESVLIRLAHYHRKPCNRALHTAVYSKIFPVVGDPRKAVAN